MYIHVYFDCADLYGIFVALTQAKHWEFECVAQTLRRASRLISRRYEDALRPVNLTSSQYTILQSLKGREGLPFGVMAEILGFDQTTLTRLLKPLVKRELITTVSDAEDRRRRSVCITSDGTALFARAKRLWQREHDESLNRISARDWQTMQRVTRELSL